METQDITFKSVTELWRGDICFIESGDKRKTGIILVVDTKESKSGKFTTIWFYTLEESDGAGEFGNWAGSHKHPKHGQLYYMSKSNKYEVEMISEKNSI